MSYANIRYKTYNLYIHFIYFFSRAMVEVNTVCYCMFCSPFTTDKKNPTKQKTLNMSNACQYYVKQQKNA